MYVPADICKILTIPNKCRDGVFPANISHPSSHESSDFLSLTWMCDPRVRNFSFKPTNKVLPVANHKRDYESRFSIIFHKVKSAWNKWQLAVLLVISWEVSCTLQYIFIDVQLLHKGTRRVGMIRIHPTIIFLMACNFPFFIRCKYLIQISDQLPK